MEVLYRRADKFSTLEDNIRGASQTVMITAQINKSTVKGPSEQKRSQGKSHKLPDRQSEKKKDPPPPPPPQFTALNIAYDRLLPLIRDLLSFKWPQPMRAGPDQRNVFENTADPTAEKFQPNREGPYIVTRSGESGSYAIDKTDGTLVPRMWNVMHLKRYYQ